MSIKTSIPLPIWTLILQVAIASTVAIGLLATDWRQALASMLALGVVVIPNALFVRAVLGSRPNKSAASPEVSGASDQQGSAEGVSGSIEEARRAAVGVLVQQFWKAGLTVLMMVGVFAFLRPQPLGFFLTLVALQFAYVLAPLVFGPARKRQRNAGN